MNVSTRWIKRNGRILKMLGFGTVALVTLRFFSPAADKLLNNNNSISQGININNNFKSLRAAEMPSTSSSLVNVILVTRHGARTPLNILPEPNHPQVEYPPELLEELVLAKYKLVGLEGEKFDESVLSYWDQKNMDRRLKGGAGRGQLTRIGERQLYDIGRELRQKYVNELKFLSPKYDHNEIYVRSSHYRRTIRSAKSLLAGLYLESVNDTSVEPFLMHIQKLEDDFIFPNHLNCPYFTEMYTFMHKLSLYTNVEYLTELIELNRVLNKVSMTAEDYKRSMFNHKDEIDHGHIKQFKHTFTGFRDDMAARHAHGLPLPDVKGVKELFEKSERYAAMELHAAKSHNLKISCGQFLHLIGENLKQGVASNSGDSGGHKFTYYSAHDSTIYAMLAAFDTITDANYEWPPFGATIVLELWKNKEEKKRKDDEFTVKAFYCGNPIAIPACGNKVQCKLSDFLGVLDTHSVQKHEYEQICSKKFKA